MIYSEKFQKRKMIRKDFLTMRKLKAIVSVLLVVAVIFGTASGVSARNGEAAATPTDAETYTGGTQNDRQTGFQLAKSIYENGVPPISTDTFFKVFKLTRTVMYIATGRIFFEKPKDFDVEVSEDVAELCNIIASDSVLDVYKILTNLPDLNEPAVLANTVFNIDTAELRRELYEARSRYRREGNNLMGGICRLLGVYVGGMKKASVYLLPVDGEDYYQITLDVTYADGYVEVYHTPIFINLETGEAFGLDEKGMLYTGFNCNIYDLLVYAPIDCWMRDFGFCIEYDILCYMLPMYRYITRRIKFDYNDREWMVQLWKGNYLITNGGEVGVYNRNPIAFGSYYSCITDEELMPMSLKITHGDEVLVSIPEQPHWWVNGFRLANRLYQPHSLTLEFTIELYDEEMLKAFTQGIDRNFYNDITYTVDGLKVYAVWEG